VSNALSRTWHRYHSLPPLQRELVTFGMALLFSLTILPLAIWVAGQIFLGDYLRDYVDPLSTDAGRQGGPVDLLVDFVRGIFAGSPGYWLVLLGPYVLLWAYRAGRRLV
jgi:hypothetical protein